MKKEVNVARASPRPRKEGRKEEKEVARLLCLVHARRADRRRDRRAVRRVVLLDAAPHAARARCVGAAAAAALLGQRAHRDRCS